MQESRPEEWTMTDEEARMWEFEILEEIKRGNVRAIKCGDTKPSVGATPFDDYELGN